MQPCHGCGNETRPEWKMCPFCGAETKPACECGATIEASWKLCPFCGRARAGAPVATETRPEAPASTPVPTSTHRQVADKPLSWRLVTCVVESWWKPFTAVFDGIRDAGSPSALLAARSPQLLVNASASAIAELGKLEADPRVPESFGRTLRHVASRRDDLLVRLRAPADALEKASAQYRQLDLPEGTGQAVMQGIVSVIDMDSSTGKGMRSGAQLGNMLVPGIGAAVGGVLGAMFSSEHSGSRNQEIASNYDAASSRMLEAVDELSDAIWDECVELAAKSGLVVERSSFFARAAEAWQPLHERVLASAQPGSTARETAEVESFIATWGPSPDALSLLIRLSLAPYRSDVDLAKVAALALELYPGSAAAHEDAADAYLQRGEWSVARRVAESGARSHPHHAGLGVSLVESLAADGADELAEKEERRLLPTIGRVATVHRARGLVRRGDFSRAAHVVGVWRDADATPGAVALQVQRDPILGSLVERGIIAPLSPEQEFRAIVESRLKSDGQKRFLGLPPEPREKNARLEIVGYLEGEATLFFFDWSVWGNAKTGFALTNRRVIWRCVWEDPVKLELNAIRPEAVHVAGTLLTIGERKVDMEDAELAEAAAMAILEMREVSCR